jgi:hypothetical protein
MQIANIKLKNAKWKKRPEFLTFAICILKCVEGVGVEGLKRDRDLKKRGRAPHD